MQTRTENYQEEVRRIFGKAKFTNDLGIELVDLGPGWCESKLLVQEKHQQQDGFVHAGVQATIADHTAGGAGGTLLAENQMVLSAEFKINLLRPASGEILTCRAEVLKAGKILIVAESEVFSWQNEQPLLIAKATVTLAVIEKKT